MTSLRDRNRRAAMDEIQRAAMDLFEQRGYAEVTIADIAREAGVSESTFYRLYRAKEGLFTAAPWAEPPTLDVASLDALGDQLRDLVTGFAWPGLRWVLEEPSVRRAVLAALDEYAVLLAGQLVDAGHPRVAAYATARQLLFGVYFTALEQWHTDGRREPFAAYFDRARAATRAER